MKEVNKRRELNAAVVLLQAIVLNENANQVDFLIRRIT